MKQKIHRTDVSEANYVVRRLKLNNSTCGKVHAAVREIEGMPGMDEVTLENTKLVLHLAYDTSRLTIEGIEIVLSRYGVELNDDWGTHMKGRYYRFADQNISDNSAHVPTCCNKAPPGAGRK